jgi:hypothetical protein
VGIATLRLALRRRAFFSGLGHLEPCDAWIIGLAFVRLFNDLDEAGLRNAEGTARKIVKRCFEAQTQQSCHQPPQAIDKIRNVTLWRGVR